MQGFSSSFLLFFHQLALGGMFALAATPFHELDRAFYKSTGGVLLVVAIMGAWGKAHLYWEILSKEMQYATIIEGLLQLLFVASLAGYIISLWGEHQTFRAKSFAASILTGLAGLVLSAHAFYLAPFFSMETLLYPIAFVLSSLLLGSVTVGMLIGHWYLIDTGQNLDPFVRIYKFFVIALIFQTAFLILSVPVLYLTGAPETLTAIDKTWRDHFTLFAIRVVIGQIAPLALSGMIWRTLLIPHTMAATGLFYIALLGVFVGEILSRQILALTSLPF